MDFSAIRLKQAVVRGFIFSAFYAVLVACSEPPEQAAPNPSEQSLPPISSTPQESKAPQKTDERSEILTTEDDFDQAVLSNTTSQVSTDSDADVSVNAGNDFWVDELEDVRLYGKVTAKDNRALKIRWMHEREYKQKYLNEPVTTDVAGLIREVSIFGRDGLSYVGFKAPDVDKQEVITIYLVATDEDDNWFADDIEVIVNPIEKPPMAFTDLDFPDPALLECVSQAAGEQGISYIDKLKKLSCKNSGISDLTGIEKLTYLEILDLSKNRIKDAAYLEHLTKLTRLSLSSNQISDIGFVKHMPAMSMLYLAQNPIKDVHEIGMLNELFYLNLNSTEVSDISPLFELPVLKRASLDNLEYIECEQLRKFSREKKVRVRSTRCVQKYKALEEKKRRQQQ